MSFRNFQVPYPINEKYSKKAAYFSMEFAIHQPLKIYSGGLGFLAGSHLRSAFELNQNMIGIGMLWKYGYYDQARNQDQTLQVSFMEKMYSFLEDTGIKYQILIVDRRDVQCFLDCQCFPLFSNNPNSPSFHFQQ